MFIDISNLDMMKNNFLFLLLLGLVFFVSCDDDDKSQTYKGDNLTLSVSGINFPGREAILEGAVLTVKQALPGETETLFTVTREGAKIAGENSNTNRVVALDGVINGDKLDLELAVKAKSSMVAKWKVDALFLNVKTDLENIEVNGESVAVADALKKFKTFGIGIKMLMRSVTFEEDANIVASYNTNIKQLLLPKFVDSPKGMALYNVIGDQIYVAMDLDKIIADATTPEPEAVKLGRSDYNPLAGLMSKIRTGLPLNLRQVEGGVEVYVEKEMLQPVMSILPQLLPLLDGQLSSLMEKQIKELVPMMVALVEASTETELGLSLLPVSE